MSKTFSFQELSKPVAWTGRYNRIPGKEPTFKAKADGTLLVYWRPWPDDEWLTSLFIDCPAVQRLAAAVNRAKAANAGFPGGAFQINEFGQVICPINNDREKLLVGTIGGVPRFHDPRDSSKSFELQEPVTSAAGEPWDRPYLGMKFNLDGNDSIYFQQDDGDTRTKLRLDSENLNLVRRLRSLRGSASSIRFIVNLHGVVLTKVEPDWRPVFVGHIELAQWFPKLSKHSS